MQKHDNYQIKVRKLIRDGVIKSTPGEVQHIDVKHDDNCSIFKHGPCDCDPDILINGVKKA